MTEPRRTLLDVRLSLLLSLGLVLVGSEPASARPDGSRPSVVRRAERQIARLELERARSLLERAIENPRFRGTPRSRRARVFATLGWARSEIGDLSGAREAFREALRLDEGVLLPRVSSPKVRATLENMRSIARTDRARRRSAKAAQARARASKPTPVRAQPPAPLQATRTGTQTPSLLGEGSSLSAAGSARASGHGAALSPRSSSRGPEPPSLAEAWSERPALTPRPSFTGSSTSAAPGPPRRPTTTWGPALTTTEVWGLAIGGAVLTAGLIALFVVLSQPDENGGGTEIIDSGGLPLFRF